MEAISTVAQKMVVSARPIAEAVIPRPYSGPCKPDCPICGGLGWMRQDVDIHHENFGKIYPCPNIPPQDLYGSFSGLLDDEYNLGWPDISDFGNALTIASGVRKVVERGYGWVYLWGGYGKAKTLILKIAVAEALKALRKAAYIRMAELIDSMRQSFDLDNPFEESAKRLDFWSGVPLLCIDEFDRVRGTEFAEERRFILMDKRYESAARGKSVTLMAANTDPKTLDGYLADRIFDGRFLVIRVTGESARPYMSYD